MSGWWLRSKFAKLRQTKLTDNLLLFARTTYEMIPDKSSDPFFVPISVSKFNNVLNWQWHNKTLKLLKSLLRVDFSENKNVESRNDFRFIVRWRLLSLSQWSVVCHNNNRIKLSSLSGGLSRFELNSIVSMGMCSHWPCRGFNITGLYSGKLCKSFEEF